MVFLHFNYYITTNPLQFSPTNKNLLLSPHLHFSHLYLNFHSLYNTSETDGRSETDKQTDGQTDKLRKRINGGETTRHCCWRHSPHGSPLGNPFQKLHWDHHQVSIYTCVYSAHLYPLAFLANLLLILKASWIFSSFYVFLLFDLR